MKPFMKCPVCGGEIVTKRVEKLVRGGSNTAVLHVTADVCLKCGERLYTPAVARKLERVRERLAEDDLDGFSVIGKAVQVG